MLSAITLELGMWEIVMAIFAILLLLLLVPFTIIDSMRSRHLSVVQKFAWVIFIIIAPYLGAVVYLFWGRKQKTL